MDEVSRTLARWFDLGHRLGVRLSAALEMAEVLTAAYGEPHRHYHTLSHIEACLGVLERVPLGDTERAEAELAVWFHDVVYDVTLSENEARSAALAKAWLAEQGLDAPEVAATIEMTAGHGLPDGASVVMRAVHDVDLAILGAPAVEYDAYAAAIRREYGHLDDDVYRLGRRDVLHRLGASKALYSLPMFRTTLEPRARANLARELAHLP
jgi:predicted metal-dependent HD superfamily phosphohydrolase